MPLLFAKTLLLVGTLLLFTSGCGAPATPATVKVAGRVTFNESTPPAAGTLFFVPLTVAEGLPRQPGSAMFNEQGEYRATTYEEHDGLIPGTYAVKIECWKKNTGYTDDRLESYVPKSFQAPQLTVPADQTEVVFNLNVPAR